MYLLSKVFENCFLLLLCKTYIPIICTFQINEIPKLSSGCTEFLDSAQEILEERKTNQTLLANHSSLLDLLEIPQLMDTYVLFPSLTDKWLLVPIVSVIRHSYMNYRCIEYF